MPCTSEYESTSSIEVALGLASTPTSWTCDPADPSIALASSIAVVVSGHMVVHSESLKPRITTLPRKLRRETAGRID